MTKVFPCFFRRSQVRFAYDLDQGNSGTVEIDQTYGPVGIMLQLAGVFFHMNSCNPDSFSGLINLNLNMPMFRYREFKLGYLVSLGQIRIEIVLTGKPAFTGNSAVGSQSYAYAVFHHLLVQNRQDARHPETDRTCVGIRRGAELSGTCAEYLRPGEKLSMYFQPYDTFKFHDNLICIVCLLTQGEGISSKEANKEASLCQELVADRHGLVSCCPRQSGTFYKEKKHD